MTRFNYTVWTPDRDALLRRSYRTMSPDRLLDMINALPGDQTTLRGVRGRAERLGLQAPSQHVRREQQPCPVLADWPEGMRFEDDPRIPAKVPQWRGPRPDRGSATTQ